ncbi:MAG: thiamine pyrophosphate-dependent enzyme, partial [Patescibacteria group bacterium]
LSHLGSCLTAVGIIEEIFKVKKPDEKFVLSAGHAALALYAVLEKYGLGNAERMFKHHGVHPDRCDECHIDCSTGSLGHGLPIAVGMALANRERNVYCLISDGECAEGSIWEALRIKSELKVDNLKIFVNCNSYSAYGKINADILEQRLKAFCPDIQFIKTDVDKLPESFRGLKAHYKTIDTKEKYEEITSSL